QTVEIDEACEPELSMTVHDKVIAERRIERRSLPGVRSNGLYADTENVALFGKEQRSFLLPAGSVRTFRVDVQIFRRTLPFRPASAKEHPALCRDLAVLPFPVFDQGHIHEEVRILR